MCLVGALDKIENNQEIIEDYINNKTPIMKTKKLDLYKNIIKHYKRIDSINIDPEEPEEQFKTMTGEVHDEEKNEPESNTDFLL